MPATEPPELVRVTVRTERPDGSGVLYTYPRVRDFRTRTGTVSGLVDRWAEPGPVITDGLELAITGVCFPAEPSGVASRAEVVDPAPGWRVDLAQLRDWPHHATTRDGAPPVLVGDLVADLLAAHARITAATAASDTPGADPYGEVRAALAGRRPPPNFTVTTQRKE